MIEKSRYTYVQADSETRIDIYLLKNLKTLSFFLFRIEYSVKNKVFPRVRSKSNPFLSFLRIKFIRNFLFT